MLAKLIKYDFRSCWKRFWPLWTAIIVLSVATAFAFRITGPDGFPDAFRTFVFTVLPVLVLTSMFIAAFVLSIIYICEQFFKDLLSDQGYLVFTLPAKIWQIIASKAVTALLLEIISFIVAALSGGAILVIALTSVDFKTIISQILEYIPKIHISASVVLMLFEMMLIALLALSAFNLRIYSAISIGSLARKNRAFASILSYIGLSAAGSFISSFFMNLFFRNIDRLLPESGVQAEFINGEVFFNGVGSFNTVLMFAMVFLAVSCAVHFLISHYILSNHLNLE